MAKTYTDNGYTYTVEDNGTVTAKGTVSEDPASRKGMSSIHPDGYDSKTDDKGHLIAAREGGVAADYNVSAQDRGLNRGAYKTIENSEVDLANKGYTVETEKTAYVSNPGEKPSAYMVNDTITTPDGKTHTVNNSFTNLSKSEMDEIDKSMQDIPMDDYPNPDPLRESMTPEEYNQLMEETDQYLGSVKDDYDIDNTINSQPGNNQQGTDAKDSTEAGVHDNDANDFDGEAPALDGTQEGGILDNDANDFDGEAPGLAGAEASDGILDNDAEDFDGEAPSCDGSVAADAGASVDDGLGVSDDGLGAADDGMGASGNQEGSYGDDYGEDTGSVTDGADGGSGGVDGGSDEGME